MSHRVVSIDNSPNSGNSVAERLGRRGIQIRDYGGPAGLKTISSPTGFAEHILVMVEDVPLNSPQNGVFDLSVLPADLFSHGEFYNGQGSSLYGSNAVGGTLNLMLDRQKSNLRVKSGSLGEKGLSGQIKKEFNLLRTLSTPTVMRAEVITEKTTTSARERPHSKLLSRSRIAGW